MGFGSKRDSESSRRQQDPRGEQAASGSGSDIQKASQRFPRDRLTNMVARGGGTPGAERPYGKG